MKSRSFLNLGLVLVMFISQRVSATEMFMQPKVWVVVECGDPDLKAAITTELSSELRRLGDVVLTEQQGSEMLIVSATAIGNLQHYSMHVKTDAAFWIMSMNETLLTSLKKECIAVNLTVYLTHVNELLRSAVGTQYRGGGREALREHCADAVATIDNGILKVLRRQLEKAP